MLALFVVEPRRGGLFAERSSPEFLTLVAVAVSLGIGIAVEAVRRRNARRASSADGLPTGTPPQPTV
jgi:hypothetical protein